MPDLPLISPLDRALFLRAHPFFQVEPRSLIAIAEHSTERRFARGETLIEADGEIRSIFILGEGSVTSLYKGERLFEVGSPGAVGTLALLAGRSVGSSFVAREETVALELDADVYLQILEDHFPLVLSLTVNLARDIARDEEIARVAPGTAQAPPLPPAVLRSKLDLVDRLSLVRRVRLFSDANLSLLTELFRGDAERHYEDGEPLCRAGQVAESFEVLVEGLVRLEDADASRPGFVDAVGVVGWRDLFTGKPRVWSATACGPVRTLHVPRELYTDVLEDHSEHVLAVLGQLARRYLEVHTLISGKTQLATTVR
jgi:CRP-like cAMP-binding protein